MLEGPDLYTFGRRLEGPDIYTWPSRTPGLLPDQTTLPWRMERRADGPGIYQPSIPVSLLLRRQYVKQSIPVPVFIVTALALSTSYRYLFYNYCSGSIYQLSIPVL